MNKAYQTYLKHCNCQHGGIIVENGIAVCRWCLAPYDEAGMINYDSSRLPSQPSTAKWSDSDVKKFLEDYRVANMDCYLNPVIWFDKLNDEK